MLQKYDTIIFDFGQVIVDLNYELCLNKFVRWVGDEQKVKSLFAYTDFHKDYEVGKITSSEFIDQSNSYFNVDIPEADFMDAWNSMVGEMPARRMDLLVELKKTKTVILLSNTNQLHEDYFEDKIRGDFGVSGMNHFVHHPLYSHRISLRKPNADIYEYVIASYLDGDASRAVFLDDRLENIEGAIACGIDSIQVKYPDQILELLK